MPSCNPSSPARPGMQAALNGIWCSLRGAFNSVSGLFRAQVVQFPHPGLPYGADYSVSTYNADKLETTTYKVGGPGGTVVKVITYGYTGDNLTSITATDS